MEAFLIIGALAVGANMLSDDVPKDEIINASAQGQWVSNTIVQSENKIVWVFENE